LLVKERNMHIRFSCIINQNEMLSWLMFLFMVNTPNWGVYSKITI
jgi:hypothetical protein